MTDIVDRLLEGPNGKHDPAIYADMREAADYISMQRDLLRTERAEIKRLRKERDEWKQCAQVEGDLHTEARTEIERLRAEIEEMKLQAKADAAHDEWCHGE